MLVSIIVLLYEWNTNSPTYVIFWGVVSFYLVDPNLVIPWIPHEKKTDIQHPVFYWLDTWEPHIFIYLRIFLTFMIHEYTPKKRLAASGSRDGCCWVFHFFNEPDSKSSLILCRNFSKKNSSHLQCWPFHDHIVQSWRFQVRLMP